MNIFTETKQFSDKDLQITLGSVAIVEGGFYIDKNGYLPDVKKSLDENIDLELTNIYLEHDKLLQLASNNIDTILMETTFTYQDKIHDVAEFLINLYIKTGWKPKKVVNTMDYGLEQLWVICNKLDIEVYKLEDSDRLSIGNLQLKKVGFDDFDKTFIAVKHMDFDELITSNIPTKGE